MIVYFKEISCFKLFNMYHIKRVIMRKKYNCVYDLTLFEKEVIFLKKSLA